MKTYYESPVGPDDIDGLGHMNMRIYGRKAALATHTLAAALGLDDARLAEEGALVFITDTHTRFHREQHEGAFIAVRGGVLSADPEAVAVYMELFNTESGDVAATFRIVFTLRRREDSVPLEFPNDVLAAAAAHIVEWPDYGRPRSISLDPVSPDSVSRDDMVARDVPIRFEPWQVEPQESDEHGFLDFSKILSIAFARMPIKFHLPSRDNPASDGRRVAIATVEIRETVFDAPRVGEHVVTYSNNADVTDKRITMQNISFVQETGRPLAIHTQLGLGFNLDTRRAEPFPPEMREKLAANRHPALD